MVRYGTNIVAGTSPTKAGTKLDDIPVYASIRDIQNDFSVDASVIFVPAPSAKSAMIEAINAQVSLIICITENIPVHDMLAVRAAQLRRTLATPAASPAARYGDWLAVRAARIENGQALLEFEALQDFVPPFAVQFHAFKHRKWRPLGNPVALPHVPDPWPAGERRTVAVPLPADVPPDRIAVALATDVQWHSSLVPFAGASAQQPFPRLAELADRP